MPICKRSLLLLILPARSNCFPAHFGSTLGVIIRKLGVREDRVSACTADESVPVG